MIKESAVTDFMGSTSAAVLEQSGVHSRSLDQAMEQVTAALSKGRSSPRLVYGVLVYGKRDRAWKPNYLAAAGTFFKAYLRGFKVLSRVTDMITTHEEQGHLRALEAKDFGDVRFFVGEATRKDVKEKMKPSPGIYIISSHLDAHLLQDLGLPLLPKPFREIPFVIQVKSPNLQGEEMIDGTADVVRTEKAAGKDTLDWRKRFMAENKCLTSEDIAQQGTSRAANRAAMASRWRKEKRIFSFRFEGQQWFPRFQFQDGMPIEAVSRVIQVFPEHATGWELAYFFVTPNPNLGGRKPMDLLKQDPVRLISLAQAFVHPADVF
jgi:hypothetical protein